LAKKKDARHFKFAEKFAAAIMLCEGAFSRMEIDEMNLQMLKKAANAIQENGKFIFT